jgi:hypothetical protein
MRNFPGFALAIPVITLLSCSSNDATPGAAGGTAGSGASTAGNGSGAASAQGGAGPSTGGSSGNPAGSSPGGSSAMAGAANLPATLMERIKSTSVEVAAGAKKGVSNWRIWDRGDLGVAPVFTVPLPNCQTLVCYSSGTEMAPVAHVVALDAEDKLIKELVAETGVECRGLAAGSGGQFAALLWKGADDTIGVSRYDATGILLGSTPLSNADNNPTDFGIGEARLEFGGGKYGAYYHVHSDSGHEGDTLKWVDAASGAEDTEWDWGCSHSMSNLLRFNTASMSFLPACVTDCYPGTEGDFETQSIGGIYLNHDDEKVLDVDAGCNGSVAGELGGAALAPMGWKLVFNAHQAPAGLGQDSYESGDKNQDIGFSAVAQNLTPGKVVWLTTTPGDESDSSISRYEPAGAPEQYLVGWVAGSGSSLTFQLALLDPSGTFLENPIDVTSLVKWGRRDDPFREHYDGDVVWAWFDQAGSTTLKVARVDSGASYTCQ